MTLKGPCDVSSEAYRASASYKVSDTSQQTSDLQLVIDVTPNSALGKLLLTLKGPCDVSSEADRSQLLQSARYKVSDTSQQTSESHLVIAVTPNSALGKEPSINLDAPYSDEEVLDSAELDRGPSNASISPAID